LLTLTHLDSAFSGRQVRLTGKIGLFCCAYPCVANAYSQQQFMVTQEREAKEAAATKKNWLLSEQTLNKQVVQGMDFTRNLEAQRHLFLEVYCCCCTALHSNPFVYFLSQLTADLAADCTVDYMLDCTQEVRPVSARL